MTILVIVLIHIGICVLIAFVKKQNNHLKMENLLPIVFAVPIFGEICFLIRYQEERKAQMGTKKLGIEKTDHMKGRYMKIEVEDNPDEQVVPLEEALSLNNAKERHSLMLNILHRRPNEYIGILQKARSSEDMEVTHYATTTMMELLTEYENQIQDYERRFEELNLSKKTEDIDGKKEFLREYILYLNEFLNSKMISGNVELLYRRRISELAKIYSTYEERLGRILFISIENYLLLNDNENALRLLKRAKEEYPDDERTYKLYGQYFDNIGDYASFQQMIQEIVNKNIYLSQEGREWLAFWRSNS